MTTDLQNIYSICMYITYILFNDVLFNLDFILTSHDAFFPPQNCKTEHFDLD